MTLKPPADAEARRKARNRENQRAYRARNQDNPAYKARVDAEEKRRPSRTATPENARKYHLKHKFNLTPEQFDAMLLAQEGRCAICSSADPGGAHGVFHIDHCHTTGKVRDLLCHSCNTALGHFNDDAAALRLAAEYLDKHADVRHTS